MKQKQYLVKLNHLKQKIKLYNAKFDRSGKAKNLQFQARKQAHGLRGKKRMEQHKQKFIGKGKKWGNKWNLRSNIWKRKQVKWNHRAATSIFKT